LIANLPSTIINFSSKGAGEGEGLTLGLIEGLTDEDSAITDGLTELLGDNDSLGEEL
jgi:hypothetical protein